jgi:hypothetical protein
MGGMTAPQLQRLLDRAGLSQRGAAKALDINERTMRKYCAGDSAIPKTVALAVRCQFLEDTLKEAWQISHYGRGSMQDIDDVLERAIRGSQSDGGTKS